MFELPSAEDVADLVIAHTCRRKCYGVAGYSASCCRLEGRDFIQGPVDDVPEVLARLSVRFGRPVAFEEMFIDFEEGSRLFPDRSRWQRREAFPAIRPDLSRSDFPCPHLTAESDCGIYEDRPAMCRRYRCDHLESVLDVVFGAGEQ